MQGPACATSDGPLRTALKIRARSTARDTASVWRVCVNAMRVGFNLFNDTRQTLSGANPITLINDFAFSITNCEFDCCVRIDDTSHAQVLVDGLPPSLVFCTHYCSNFEAVKNLLSIFKPNVSAFARLGCTILTSIESEVDVDC